MPTNAQQSLLSTSQCLEFDQMLPNGRFSVSTAAEKDLPFLAKMTAGHIPSLQGTYQGLERVQRQSRSVLAVRSSNELIGCFAALLLNNGGFDHLLRGSLSIACPSPSCLAWPGETPAAIYVWALCIPGLAVGAAGNIMQWLRQETYARADLYASPSTPKGKAFMIRGGFKPLEDFAVHSLWVYRRSG